MHKDGKWAREIISMQDDEGKWGWFHSLSQFSGSTLTTEQALRRLERLGYTIEDECIQKAVSYMDDCLTGKKAIPDRAEKVHDWNVFSSLILSTWIRRFTDDNQNANAIADKWAKVVTAAFISGAFDRDDYVAAYREILKPNGGRIIDCDNFYHVSLLNDRLDAKTEIAFVDYLINNDKGIYYIYDGKISAVPDNFESRNASRYLASVELLSKYKQANHKLGFVTRWLNDNKNENGKWDMGTSVNDKVYFPLSDSWRKKETREADCTERIERLISEIS